MGELISATSAMALPNPLLIAQHQSRRKAPKAQPSSANGDSLGIVRQVFEMAELEPHAGAWRQKSNRAAADVESKEIALGIEQAYLCADARMHKAEPRHQVRPQ